MGIADEIITRGWCKRALEDDEGRVCLLGAANVVDCGGPNRMFGKRDAARAVRRVLHSRGYSEGIAPFNNAPERTFDEVLRVAKEADELLDAGRT